LITIDNIYIIYIIQSNSQAQTYIDTHT